MAPCGSLFWEREFIHHGFPPTDTVGVVGGCGNCPLLRLLWAATSYFGFCAVAWEPGGRLYPAPTCIMFAGARAVPPGRSTDGVPPATVPVADPAVPELPTVPVAEPTVPEADTVCTVGFGGVTAVPPADTAGDAVGMATKPLLAKRGRPT